MMSESYAKIEAYLQDEMEVEERQAFEKACAEDTVLAEEFAFYLQAREASASLGREQRKQALIDRHNNQAYKLKIPTTWLFAAAAMIVLIVGSYWAIIQFRSPPTLENLLAQHLVQGQLPLASGSRNPGDEPVNSDWVEAKDAYTAGNYEKSLSLCRQLENKLPTTEESDLHLIWGISALKMDENIEAAQALKKVFSVLFYNQEAIWFESLAYLKAEQYGEARKALNKIAENSSHYRHRQALELLEILE